MCVKDMIRPGPVRYWLYPDPSTPMELITPSPEKKKIQTSHYFFNIQNYNVLRCLKKLAVSLSTRQRNRS